MASYVPEGQHLDAKYLPGFEKKQPLVKFPNIKVALSPFGKSLDTWTSYLQSEEGAVPGSKSFRYGYPGTNDVRIGPPPVEPGIIYEDYKAPERPVIHLGEKQELSGYADNQPTDEYVSIDAQGTNAYLDMNAGNPYIALNGDEPDPSAIAKVLESTKVSMERTDPERAARTDWQGLLINTLQKAQEAYQEGLQPERDPLTMRIAAPGDSAPSGAGKMLLGLGVAGVGTWLVLKAFGL